MNIRTTVDVLKMPEVTKSYERFSSPAAVERKNSLLNDHSTSKSKKPVHKEYHVDDAEIQRSNSVLNLGNGLSLTGESRIVKSPPAQFQSFEPRHSKARARRVHIDGQLMLEQMIQEQDNYQHMQQLEA